MCWPLSATLHKRIGSYSPLSKTYPRGRQSDAYKRRSPNPEIPGPDRNSEHRQLPGKLSALLPRAFPCSPFQDSGGCWSLSPSVFLILPYSGSQQRMCWKPGLNYHPLPNLPYSKSLALMQSMEGKQSLLFSRLSGLPSKAFPGLLKSLCPDYSPTVLHAIHTCACNSEAGPLPIIEVSPLGTQFSEDIHMNICSIREYLQVYVEAPE